jgi:hypothetical protein
MMNLQQKKTFKAGVRWLALSGALAVLRTGSWLIYAQTIKLTKVEKDLRRAIHTAIKAVTEDLGDEYQFNTAF